MQNPANRANKPMPSHTKTLTSAILSKWREQQGFIRFLDGDKANCCVANLTYIGFKDALEHWDDWVFDWDMNLTRREKSLANDPEWRAGLVVS